MLTGDSGTASPLPISCINFVRPVWFRGNRGDFCRELLPKRRPREHRGTLWNWLGEFDRGRDIRCQWKSA